MRRESSMIRKHETYLGDGVYAWTDGYQLWLRTERDDGEHTIALEPAVFAALITYEKRLRVPRESNI